MTALISSSDLNMWTFIAFLRGQNTWKSHSHNIYYSHMPSNFRLSL